MLVTQSQIREKQLLATPTVKLCLIVLSGFLAVMAAVSWLPPLLGTATAFVVCLAMIGILSASLWHRLKKSELK
jgi:hypothetical protein